MNRSMLSVLPSSLVKALNGLLYSDGGASEGLCVVGSGSSQCLS